AIETLVLDDAPIEVRLAVLPPFGSSKEHNDVDSITKTIPWESGRSSLQVFLTILPVAHTFQTKYLRTKKIVKPAFPPANPRSRARRAELSAVNCTDIERVRQGIVINIRWSKTDQEGVGRKVAIPLGRTKWCPVAALDNWLAATGIEDGAVFRRVDRHGRVSAGPLSAEAVSLVVRERIAAAGFDPGGYSGHSLRAGFATSAAQAGVSMVKIRAQTGHASDAMLARYVRDGELFLGNAAGAML
ncbi:MAG TPA: site-specific integrase, partial [Roseiarcus sp.]|nr:site-specific integrase [Roseiarcus sp.]